MAILRDTLGNINRQEFENHLKARTRKEGYMEILMYTPDLSIQVSDISSTDKLNVCDISTISNIDKYTNSTIATLEENLWLLNGRFITYQGGLVDGYISNSVSDENGEFTTTPSINIQLSRASKIENFSVILNSAVPTGYPKDITIKCYDGNDTLLNTFTQNIEWQEDTGEVDEEDQPVYRTVLLDSLPSVNFEMNVNNVSYIVIEFGDTRFRHRRIRVSSIAFGKTLVLDQDSILNVDYMDKTSYVCDTLPSRTFRFDVNNYEGIYNVDNPNNGYVKLNKQTRVRFRNGYNVYGYEYDENGYVVMEDGAPVIDYSDQDSVEIEWDNWKELRLMDVSANADESATFTAGSLLDIMEDTYTQELYNGADRTVQEIAESVLTFEGLDLNSIEWSSDGIPKPTYNEGTLLPYEQWEDTVYNAYTVNMPMPEVQCKQILQLLAFTVGATILIKDNGHIKFANLNITDSNTFTDHYNWNYQDFESIPAAEQLATISDLTEISLPKYYANLDYSGEETIRINDYTYANCTVITTVNCNVVNTETSYSECLPIGCRMANDDTSGATIAYNELYCRRGIINLGGFVGGTTAKVEILGYPIRTKQIQERNVTSNSLVLDTKIIKDDVSSYNSDATINEKEQIKRKYLEWYKKKFKYKITTRGEPLVNAGDYAIIQTQFTGQMPAYILQNHWTFDGTWSGDMEVIALD